ncbi:putative pectinesterase/pectinesterase inhibitor 17 [Sesamum angolense]|uniref:pectinesterase n=1 Tax=Sesamum angolense TaxID=2727404 RepID=A0AAE1W965_9LAMI|nr:putative pectinesterase/pectinesterase inhibitor 17 [Sesamum angolense]
MTTGLSILYSFPVLVSLLLPNLTICNASEPWNLTIWCSRTPHPRICESRVQHIFPHDISLEHFEQATMILAIQEAVNATKIIWQNVYNLKTEREKTRWKSCSNHIDAAIHDLATAISAGSDDGRQDPLNKALTSVAECYKESVRGKIKENHLEVISSHLYKLVENAIAVNNSTITSSMEVERNLSGKQENGYAQIKVVVAKDGSGDFKTIKAALDTAQRRADGRFLIHLKKGTYNEYVVIPSHLNDITMIGDGIGKTIITGNKHSGHNGIDTYTSATFAVEASGFIAQGITFRNTAGSHGGQAVALRSHSDHSAFYKCSFEGYQDTLFLFPGRHFFRDCDIYGSMDMICGDSTAVFQNCNIFLRKHTGDDVVITAQKRSERDGSSGFVIQNSRVVLTEELRPLGGVRVFLGRPWGKFSRTVFMKTYLEGISRQGWRDMKQNRDGNLVYYAEFENTGPGADTSGRIKWRGVRVIDEKEASEFTVGRFLHGSSWLPATGIPYDSDL